MVADLAPASGGRATGLSGSPGRWLVAAVVSFLIFGLATAPGLISDGFNPDDWRQVHGAPVGGMPLNWTTEEGRWVMELYYVHLLGERFRPVLQSVLAAAVFFLLAALLARRAVPAASAPVAAVLIFVLGVHHIYMINALTFSSHVFAYPLALLLSALAFVLFDRALDGPIALRVLAFLGGAQCLALSAGIYQPFAIFGASVLCIGAIRVDVMPPRRLLLLAAVSVSGAVAGIAMYLVEWQIAVALHPHDGSFRFGTVDGVAIGDKLRQFPRMLRRVWSGSLQVMPQEVRLANLGLLVTIAGLVAAATVQGARRENPRWFAVLRVLAGTAGLMVVLPTLVWLGGAGEWVPARVVAFTGLLAAVAYLSSLAVATAPRRLPLWSLLPPALLGAVYVGVAVAVWSDQTETGNRDRALAARIYERVRAQDGYDGKPFRIVGGISYSDLAWGDMIGWTVFHRGNLQPGIFKDLFGLPWYADGGLFDGPLACDAFPAPGSVYTEDGTVYVCLSRTEGFLATARCGTSAGRPGWRICLTPHGILRADSDCSGLGRGHRLAISTEDAAASIGAAELSLTRGSGCFYTSEWYDTEAETLKVAEIGPDGTVRSRETIALDEPFD